MPKCLCQMIADASMLVQALLFCVEVIAHGLQEQALGGKAAAHPQP